MNDKRNDLIEELKTHKINFQPIQNDWSGNCFGCAPKNKSGLQIQIGIEDNKCVSYTSISEHFCGFEGIAHGGIIATLLDEISAWTIVLNLKKFGLTLEAKFLYHNPVFIKKIIKVEGEIKNIDGKYVIVQSGIYSMDKRLLAECKMKFLTPDIPTLAKITKKDENDLRIMIEESLKSKNI